MEMPQSSAGPTDQQLAGLLASLREGDGQAGVMLDRLYRDTLVRFCWGYLGRMDEAEDAVQDVCYKVLSAETIPDSFRAWMYRIARNQCLNLLRNRRRRKDNGAIPAPSQIHEQLTGHLTRLVREEERCRLTDLVRALPEAQREALHLRYVESLSRKEIAEVLDIPESMVKSRLFQGISRLREHISFPE